MSDIVDKAILQELQELMEDDFPSLLETFLSESQRQFQSARQAWQGQDFGQLRHAAHSLKGSCGNIGALGLHDTCADLEASAQAEQTDDIDQLLARTETQLREVTDVVSALM